MAENDEKKQEEILRFGEELKNKIGTVKKELEVMHNRCPNDRWWNDTKKELFDVLEKLREIEMGIPPIVAGLKRSFKASRE